MESSRDNSNGERDRDAENPTQNPTSYGQGASQSSQLQPNSRSSFLNEEMFGIPTGVVDFETLESSFRSLSFVDPTLPPPAVPRRHHHQQNPFLDHPLTNRSSASSSSRINGRGDVLGGGADWYLDEYLRDMERMMMNQHYSPNVYLNERVPMSGGRFLNGNSRQVPYLSRGFVPQMDNNNGFGYWNGNSREVPYLPRGFVPQMDNNNGFGYWNEGFLNNHLEPSLSDLDNAHTGSYAMSAKNRHSSFFLLKKIDVGAKETIDEIFNDFIFHIVELMEHTVASLVLQKLMVKCSSEQITQIVEMITQNQFRFVTLCIHDAGTRSVQSLVKCLHTEEQILRFVGAVSMGALALSRNNYAKHVILQCLKEFHPSQTRNLLEVIARNCYQIGIDQQGCCMLQECLGPRGTCQVVKEHLIHAIIANSLRLCLNKFGNYAVQYVVELARPHVLLSLVQKLLGSYAFLSRNKYGSHVVQKLLQIRCIDPSIIIYDLLPDLHTLLLDPFGNFVVQTAWFACEDELRIMLRSHIEGYIPLMSCNKFGSKILTKLNL